MQSPSPFLPVQQFILDCADLASSLDSLEMRDHRGYLLAAILSGRTRYDALLLRRQHLSPSSVEEGWLEFMLDGLLARVRFLESHIGKDAPAVRELPS
ncbi:MAG TPA: hypothetical protein VMI06_00295 [Terriglobia bacterium]|nr:hypothetical protein [Terriglobia bacterium]